jgi:tRNA U34 5-methylaminomethyl-2-thiouridine-forming methyltransferase MnmC
VLKKCKKLKVPLEKTQKLNQIINTEDGSHTIYVPELNEHYHSVHGAAQESTHIFLNNGFETCKADPLYILEIGFGTGLNALLTAKRSIYGDRIIYYSAIEKYPLDAEIIGSLNHYKYAGENGEKLFHLIHSVPWNQYIKIHENFYLEKIENDFTKIHLNGKFDLIYFDAFGPDKQPEMWTREMFTGIAAVTNKDGILVTYSAKGEVKRSLRASGFEVTLIPGPPGKRQMIRAVKI